MRNMQISNIIKRVIGFKSLSNTEYIELLRGAGAKIGVGVHFWSPSETNIDKENAFLLSIGDYSRITKGVTILMHDYAKSVARMYIGENIGGKAPVRIGSNVFIGRNAIILMGTEIGDNTIIGAGSVVKGRFYGGGNSRKSS